MSHKKISKLNVISIVVGSIIGTGAFLLPGDLFLKKIGLTNTVIGILVGMLIIFTVEKNYNFLMKKFPKAGGEYIFTKNSLGSKHAFICGWLLTLSYFTIIPLNATAVPVVINSIFPNILKFGYLYDFNGGIYLGEVIVSILSLVIFMSLNIRGIKLASTVQNVMVLFLVGIILFFGGAFLYLEGMDSVNLVKNLSEPISFINILKVLSIAPFLFIGFDCIPQIIEELDFHPKNISVLSFFSILIGGFLYIILTIIASYGVTMKDLLTLDINWAVGYTVEYFFYKTGLIFLGIAFFTAIIGGINGFYMASSRLILAMAEDKELPIIFAKKVNNEPKNALIILCILSIIITLSGRNTVLWSLDVSSVGASIAYFYTSYTAFHFRDKNKFPMFQVIGMLVGIIFTLLLLVPRSSISLTLPSYITLIIWIIIGVVFKKLK